MRRLNIIKSFKKKYILNGLTKVSITQFFFLETLTVIANSVESKTYYFSYIVYSTVRVLLENYVIIISTFCKDKKKVCNFA